MSQCWKKWLNHQFLRVRFHSSELDSTPKILESRNFLHGLPFDFFFQLSIVLLSLHSFFYRVHSYYNFLQWNLIPKK